jgi:hypothetical protein
MIGDPQAPLPLLIAQTILAAGVLFGGAAASIWCVIVDQTVSLEMLLAVSLALYGALSMGDALFRWAERLGDRAC